MCKLTATFRRPVSTGDKATAKYAKKQINEIQLQCEIDRRNTATISTKKQNGEYYHEHIKREEYGRYHTT